MGTMGDGREVGRLLDAFPSPLREETIDHCVNRWDEEVNAVIYEVDEASGSSSGDYRLTGGMWGHDANCFLLKL